MLGSWRRELRHGARRLLQSPGPTSVAVLTLALGIGASATVFSVFNAVLLTPLPFDNVDELVRLRQTREIPGQPARATSVTGQNYRAWQERSSRFSDMAAARFRALALSGEGDAERIRGISATWNHFQVLGANPLIGRTFQADEDQPGNPAPVVVISHSLWSRRFGQDPGFPPSWT